MEVLSGADIIDFSSREEICRRSMADHSVSFRRGTAGRDPRASWAVAAFTPWNLVRSTKPSERYQLRWRPGAPWIH